MRLFLNRLFNQNLIFNNIFQREAVYFKTNDLKIIENLYKMGWEVYFSKTNFMVKAPEISLVDLSDPYVITDLGSSFENLAFFNILNKFIKTGVFNEYLLWILRTNQYKNFYFVVPKIKFCDTQFRLIGSDFRVRKLRKLLFNEVKKNKLWRKYYEEARIF